MSDLDEFLQQVGQQTSDRDMEIAAVGQNPSQNQDWAKLLASAACWARSGNAYFPVNSVVNEVPAGAYRCVVSDRGPYLDKMAIKTDSLLNLPDSATEKVLGEFNNFWELKSLFDERGFTFKRGILMWGPPGSGKTSAVWQMTERLVKDRNGIVIFVEAPEVTTWLMGLLRRIEPERPVVTIMEDIDSIIRRHGDHHLLALLDGEFQTNNVVHIATTNYPSMLDRRFIDRPSRFDTIMKVGMPSEEARRLYFTVKEPSLDETTLERWVRKTEDYSVAHLREVCIAIQCFAQNEEDVFYRLDKMRQSNYDNISEQGVERKFGFTGGFPGSKAKTRREII